jgi:hypothetical protein
LYGGSLAPGLTWSHNGADGGDLLAAALTCGVPHPPGYPLYELILRSALALPGTAANPAYTGNWLSAVCAVMAVALLADLARRSLPDRPGRSGLALVAALAWAATPALWGQAVITEVYTLQALAVVALLWLLWRWREGVLANRGQPGAWPWLVIAGLTLGLGLGNHLSLLLITPGMATWLWSYRAALARMPRWAWVAVGISMGAGLAVYLYLPWAAAAQPPVNWGDPSTPAGFFWLATARAYGGLLFGVPWTSLLARLGAWAAEALRQFWPWGAALAIWGLWRLDRIDHPWWRLTGLTALAFSLFALSYNTADAYIYLIPAWAAAALWLPHGLAALADVLAHQLSRIAPNRTLSSKPDDASRKVPRRRMMHDAAITYLVVALSLLAIPGVSTLGHWREMDLRQDHAAQEFLNGTLAAAKPDGVILLATDQPTFALWYAVYGLRERSDLILLNVNLYGYPWYRQILAAQHPAVAKLLSGPPAEPDLAGLIRDLARSHPLYRAEPLGLRLTGYSEQTAGPLVQLISQDAQPF